jgi:hypothetical protein
LTNGLTVFAEDLNLLKYASDDMNKRVNHHAVDVRRLCFNGYTLVTEAGGASDGTSNAKTSAPP